ncbi:MAG: cupin domain-containing protein [Candidatus Binataceae bacterium]
MPPRSPKIRRKTAPRRISPNPIRTLHEADKAESSVLRRCDNYRWSGVEVEPYKLKTNQARDFAGASRQVLAGKAGEKTKFHVRYFELQPGGFTSLEHHRHSHLVIGVRGHGRVRIGDSCYDLRRFDTLYIGPHRPHRLEASGRGRFGFFCIVDAHRDKPRPFRE